jgi:hypothetical protein
MTPAVGPLSRIALEPALAFLAAPEIELHLGEQPGVTRIIAGTDFTDEPRGGREPAIVQRSPGAVQQRMRPALRVGRDSGTALLVRELGQAQTIERGRHVVVRELRDRFVAQLR